MRDHHEVLAHAGRTAVEMVRSKFLDGTVWKDDDFESIARAFLKSLGVHWDGQWEWYVTTPRTVTTFPFGEADARRVTRQIHLRGEEAVLRRRPAFAIGGEVIEP